MLPPRVVTTMVRVAAAIHRAHMGRAFSGAPSRIYRTLKKATTAATTTPRA